MERATTVVRAVTAEMLVEAAMAVATGAEAAAAAMAEAAVVTDEGAPCFVAFSTIDDEPWEAGSDVGALLDCVRELASLGIGLVRFTEILDCGDEAGDVLSEGTQLAEARGRFQTVFRGEGVPGLGPVTLDADGLGFGPDDGSRANAQPRKAPP